MTVQDRTPRSRVYIYRAWQIGVPIALLILWEGLYVLIGQPALASIPQSIGAILSNLGSWGSQVGATLKALVVSLVICGFAGLLIGFAIGLSSFWTRVFSPILVMLYSIPKVVLYPVFLLIFGVSFSGKVAFAVFHGIFPIVIMCMNATREIPQVYLKVGKTYRLSFIQKVRYIIVPSIMPGVVQGLRTGFTTAFQGVIVSEMFASYSGIGYLLMNYSSVGNTASILGMLLIIVVLALLISLALLTWEQRSQLRYTGYTKKEIMSAQKENVA